ncbi:hypothetical protein [Soonwooa sp.]|uniref:hypothetical protein n=1 Tax=Soonwooa sp. TaxID=1938592 RepID=UPI0028AA3937|nr:hypothetical protein [Soonwooa sp.]
MKTKRLKEISPFLVLLFIINCSNKKDWNQTDFDETLTQNDSIKLMSSFYDPMEFYNDSLSNNKKTSFVNYDNDNNKNICEAKIINDTININIGYSTGFSSKGFNITYFDKKFSINPYYGTDNIAVFIDENGKEIQEEPPKHFFNNQKLILNKSDYKKGDSIYGFVNFSSLETNKNQRTNHKGKGYFKTIVQ